MNPRVLSDSEYAKIQAVLTLYFDPKPPHPIPRTHSESEETTPLLQDHKAVPRVATEATPAALPASQSAGWQSVVGVLHLLLPDRALAKKILAESSLLKDSKNTIRQLSMLCARLQSRGILPADASRPLYWYRLPVVLGEYPRHTREINRAIYAFNELIEEYYQHKLRSEQARINRNAINERFLALITKLETHGQYCLPESLMTLINLLHGYSAIDLTLTPDEKKPTPHSQRPSIDTALVRKHRIAVLSATEKNKEGARAPFIEQSIYPINQAGRLTEQTSKLVVNGFGLKFGGHFDALQTQTPRLIPVDDFYSMVWRELSQHMDLPKEDTESGVELRVLLLTTLKKLGVVIDGKNESSDPSDCYISPFSALPQAFLTPFAIKKRLISTARQQTYSLTEEQELILSDYLSRILYRMQFNVSSALGIGANDDDTVSFSNEGRDYFYQFDPAESEWAARFAQLSLHRQGPAQARMNAAHGAKYELSAAFVTDASRMSQLQKTEYPETVYHALIDNWVAELFPHPDYLENSQYKKFRKNHILSRDESQKTHLETYLEESETGIFKENGQTTPKFRRAGTIDIHALPKNQGGVSETLQSFNSRNPLAAKQFQYMQALQGGVRGDVLYNPIGRDGFVADPSNGQVIKNSDGSIVPFIGVIPKNFDKEFGMPSELCASFVVRMLHSSRLMTHCPTFRLNYQRLKSIFLPKGDDIPALPASLAKSTFLSQEFKTLIQSLALDKEALSFEKSEKLLASLFKNCVYQLRENVHDEMFLIFHHHLITEPTFLRELSREQFEKTLRILKINAPTQQQGVHQRYCEQLQYLETLIQAFYPTPNSETAKAIHILAKIQVKFLMANKAIRAYFKSLTGNAHINLSRTQSPGMLFTKLRDNVTPGRRSLEAKYADFNRMHTQNFISGYRDPEGGMVIQPSNVDEAIDFTTKGLGKVSVSLQNENNPFGQVIASPVSAVYRSVKDAKDMSQAAKRLAVAPLLIVGGATEGCFKLLSYGVKFVARPIWSVREELSYSASAVNLSTPTGKATMAALVIPCVLEGVVRGITESTWKLLRDVTVAPVADLMDCVGEKRSTVSATPDHALIIPATPDNEPGYRVQMSNQTRDCVLASSSPAQLISALRSLLDSMIKTLYPAMPREDRQPIAQTWITEALLTASEWAELVEPFKGMGALEHLSKADQGQINQSLIAVLYRCFLEKLPDRRLRLAKELSQEYHLFPEQQRVVNQLIEYYEKHPKEQEQLQFDFSGDGSVQQALKQRDMAVLKIHDVVMHAFDPGAISQALTVKPRDQSESILSPALVGLQQQTKSELAKIENTLKVLNRELKHADSPEEIIEIESDLAAMMKHKKQLEDKLGDIQQPRLPVSSTTAMMTSFESKKDKAHRKWSQFAVRELEHRYLTQDQIDEIIASLLSTPVIHGLSTLSDAIRQLRSAALDLMQLTSAQHLDHFYLSYVKVKTLLNLSPSSSYPVMVAQELEGLVNVMMNVAVNRLLDRVEEKQKDNPLSASRAAGDWLASIYQNPDDFRSLLAQQLDQPLLEKAIVRQAYLIHALEQSLQMSSSDRLHHTGLQKLLRLHYLQAQAVKKNGSCHYASRSIQDFEAYLSSRGVKESPTLHYAETRVKMKLGLFDSSKREQGVKSASLLETASFRK